MILGLAVPHRCRFWVNMLMCRVGGWHACAMLNRGGVPTIPPVHCVELNDLARGIVCRCILPPVNGSTRFWVENRLTSNGACARRVAIASWGPHEGFGALRKCMYTSYRSDTSFSREYGSDVPCGSIPAIGYPLVARRPSTNQ